jgi:hypothetical protein
MSYLHDPSTSLLGVQCLICSTPLRDAKSVEIGIGPTCRRNWADTSGIDEGDRQTANKLIHAAASAKRDGDTEAVIETAGQLAALGLTKLADRIYTQFVTVRLVGTGSATEVHTPYDPDFPRSLRRACRQAVRRVDKPDTRKFSHFEVKDSSKRMLLLSLSTAYGGHRAYTTRKDAPLGSGAVFVIPTVVEFREKYVDQALAGGHIDQAAADYLLSHLGVGT